jgi:hypothetical protein
MFDCSTEKTQDGDSAYGRKNTMGLVEKTRHRVTQNRKRLSRLRLRGLAFSKKGVRIASRMCAQYSCDAKRDASDSRKNL